MYGCVRRFGREKIGKAVHFYCGSKAERTFSLESDEEVSYKDSNRKRRDERKGRREEGDIGLRSEREEVC